MKKKIALGLLATMITATGVAMASPVEMEQGKWNVNMGAMISPDGEQDETINQSRNYDLDGDTSFYGGVTYGLTDKWGLQVDYSHYGGDAAWGDVKLDATEFNVLYKLDPHVNAFAGYLYAGAKETLGSTKYSAHTDGFQVGLTGWYPLGDKVKTFGKVGIGNNSHIYEIGFSYAVADNWDVDLSYRDVKYKDFKDGRIIDDYSFDGVRLGLSTSF